MGQNICIKTEPKTTFLDGDFSEIRLGVRLEQTATLLKHYPVFINSIKNVSNAKCSLELD